MSDDITLPPGARLDPRLGKLGAQYVFLTCEVCGRESRILLSQVRHQMRCGMCCWGCIRSQTRASMRRS